MCRHRWLGVVVAFLIAASARGQSHLEQDEATLRSHSLPTDGKGLVDFFQKRSLKDGDEKHLADLVKKLGSDVYREREPAAKELVSRGPVALPFLRSVLPTAPLEMKRRAEKCILDIEATMQAEPIGAAARVLAARKEPRGAEVLFNFLPAVASDPFLEEEVLACVGRLAITPEKVDPLLVNALKDPLSFRRMVAVYLIGRRAGPDLRQTLRDMLNDEDPRVRERVAEGFYGKRAAAAMQESAKSDEELLKKANVAVTEDGLLEFFRKRTLSDGDQAKYRALVKKMGHSAYVEREKAHKQLLQEGTRVLAFLKEVEYDDNVELSRRSRECLEAIRGANNPAVPIAAARLLTRPKNDKASPAKAIRTL
jgi:hypothetical protein